ncbi:hypothetical protein J6590_040436 [Homalodisca vitripennis]|nr:hypothetical protein J6590_040436 [Homalodisca vitripennis]
MTFLTRLGVHQFCVLWRRSERADGGFKAWSEQLLHYLTGGIQGLYSEELFDLILILLINLPSSKVKHDIQPSGKCFTYPVRDSDGIVQPLSVIANIKGNVDLVPATNPSPSDSSTLDTVDLSDKSINTTKHLVPSN